MPAILLSDIIKALDKFGYSTMLHTILNDFPKAHDAIIGLATMQAIRETFIYRCKWYVTPSGKIEKVGELPPVPPEHQKQQEAFKKLLEQQAVCKQLLEQPKKKQSWIKRLLGRTK